VAIGDIYRLQDLQIYGGLITLRNVYWYVQTGDGSAASPIADALIFGFVNDMFPVITPVQWGGIYHSEVSCENLASTEDFATELFLPGDFVGSASGEGLPPFNAWAFRYQRASTLVRNGAKRIAGVTETDLDNGVANSSALTRLAALANHMESDLELDSGELFKPVIVHQVKVDDVITYTPYDVSGVSYIRVSTQNTRKR
jgi:hypothetical protein